MNELTIFLKQIEENPTVITFDQTIKIIEEFYDFTPTAFENGDLKNDAGQNNGSCKIFAFGKLNQITDENTLNLFGDYYRRDVLENPNGKDHQNIRNFMNHGWAGITFHEVALFAK